MSQEDKTLFKWMKLIAIAGLIFAVLLLFLFAINQNYDLSESIDSGIFGTYGDVIGGVLGTIIGFYTAYLLIRTFQNQSEINANIQDTNKNVVETNKDIVETNKSIVETNKSVIEANKSTIEANKKAEAASERQYYQTELQLFDNKFQSFLGAYHKAISNYGYMGTDGRRAFEKLARNFINTQFSNKFEYKRRCKSAIEEYSNFYSAHRTMMSVHLRMLYLLMSLISKSSIDEDDKRQYAKLVRGQMSNSEMLIVRYNCFSIYGAKMRVFCNQYNLTKHLAVTNLLEFRSYKNIISDQAKIDEKNKEKLLSSLDAMFITLRKKATGMLYHNSEMKDEYKTSYYYTIQMLKTADNSEFRFIVTKDESVERRGGGEKTSSDELALDCLSLAQLSKMFMDFIYELFVFSSFEAYETYDNLKVDYSTDKTFAGKGFRFQFEISGSKPLALSYIQKTKRDNPEEDLEQ